MSLTNAKHSVAVLSVALLISLAGALLIFVQRSPRVVTSADGYIVKLEGWNFQTNLVHYDVPCLPWVRLLNTILPKRIMRNLNLPGPKFAYICPADANPRFRGEPLLSAAFSIQFPEQAEVNDNFPVMVSGDRDQEFYAGHALLLSSAKGRPITLHGLFSAEAFPRLAVSQSRFVNFLSKPEQLREDSTPQQN